MDTHITQGTRKRPLYKRPWFWLLVVAALLIGGGLAYYLANDRLPVVGSADQQDQGKVEIYTSPEKAKVLVDGQERRGSTPMKFSAPLGRHTVTLKLDGYDEATIAIEVTKERPAIIQQTFTKNGQITTDQKPEDFKTYTNERYKYRIKYPDDWEVEAAAPEVVNFMDRNRAEGPEQGMLPGVSRALAHGEDQTPLTILTQPNPGNLLPSEWYRSRPEFAQEDQSQITTREITVNGRPAFQYETPYGFVPYLNTVVTGNGQAFILQQIKSSPYRTTYDQVIQTFTLF